jgi:hypothetical protein
VTDDNTARLTPEHAQYLAGQAVNIEIAESLGVRSLLTRADTADLGGVWVNWANFPAILFPWTNEAGVTEYQVRPDNPTTGNGKKPRKYVFRRDMTPVLWAVRPVPTAERMLIIEGTKQGLAGASYAPPGVAVYSIAGCRMWQVGKSPIPDLAVAEGREVVVILDGDAADNPDVYRAGVELAEALALEGATKVSFGRLPPGSKDGLDDVLGSRPANRRATWLARVIETAKPKPADKIPRPTNRKTGTEPGGESDDGRPTIVCNNDRFEVINNLSGALVNRWDGKTLFNHGGVISRLSDEGSMTPVDRGSFHDIVQETAKTVNESNGAQGTTYSFAWPDAGTMSATMSRAAKFSPLDRISHAPFVRPDGTVVTEPGYDEATRTLLFPDETFAGIEVPDEPSPGEVAAAREFLLTEWMGDFPLDSDADRANLLGLIVTPAIRGMVPRAPLAVIDGLQMGVGKNLLVDCLLTVYTGHAAQPMNWVTEPEELRKQITSAFRTGKEFFAFDEAHTLEGTALAQALTAETWQDRILGVSTMANFPNRVTWISMGNNVQVKGDITRRVYRIALRPDYANPQDRRADSFRHPGLSGLDLGSWTRKHRRELMVAILTLIRAWFVQGQPLPQRGVSFGSFEAWEKIVGGIVETAGLTGFLGNLRVWRSESDFDTQYWEGHLRWLREQFGERSFKTAEVKEKALTDPAGFAAPPKLDDPTEKTYGKSLGEGYSRLRGRRYGGFWIERDGHAHGHVSLWRVFDQGEDLPPAPGPLAPPPQPVDEPVDDEPDQTPEPAPENEHAEARGPAPEDTDGEGHDEVRGPADECAYHGMGMSCSDGRHPDTEESISQVVTFDLETGDAADLHKSDPQTYVRIGATATDDDPVIPYDGPGTSVPRAVAQDIRFGQVVTGHNIMAFDLPALVRAGAITMPEVHRMAADGRLFDGLLAGRYLDPPMARDKGVDATRKYDLGALGEKYGLGAKLSDVSKELAKRYGGWDDIPIDDSEDGRAFKAYMVQDVELSRRLYGELTGQLSKLGPTAEAYLRREHRVAAVAAQISLNGFLVDQDLLTERVDGVNATKANAMDVLAGKYGIPTTDAKGKPYASPLASKAGKLALETALTAAGVSPKSLWRTAKSKDLEISGEAMLHYGREYHHKPEVVEIAKNVYRIVGARSVYQTAQNSLCPDGRVHPKIGFEQATGRWSLTNPGLTVFGKRGGRHVERDVFGPDPGELLVSFDLSQVDMRAVAGHSQDKAYIEMLKREDPHAELAIALFGDVSFREQAKAIGHGWNYGESLRRISETNNIEPRLVVQFDTSMHERFGRLVEWREEVRALGESGALLDNGFGRLMRPDPQRAHTQAPALMGQGAARDLMMEGILHLPGEVLPMLRAQVHDEIVLSIPADQIEDVSRVVIDALSFEWKGVPILADRSKAGTSWGMCYTKS